MGWWGRDCIEEKIEHFEELKVSDAVWFCILKLEIAADNVKLVFEVENYDEISITKNMLRLRFKKWFYNIE